MSDPLLTTPLDAEHRNLNARMVEFAGYSMPVQYTSVTAEAKAVREGVGMFDVSHMARLEFTGERVLDFLEHVTTNDVSKLPEGGGHYSLLPNEQGGTVDDIIVYRLAPDRFRMVVNASNHQKDLVHLHAHNTFGVTIEDQTEGTAMIAVQGPRAAEIVASLSDDPESILLAPLFGLNSRTIAGVPCFAPRSGYTGEDGFELICAAEHGPALWQALLERGVTPCGLGSRDTLRVEAGLPLYGHELREDLSPLAAGLGWVISKTKSFLGSDKINQARQTGVPEKIHGIRLQAKRLLQAETPVFVRTEVLNPMSGVADEPVEVGRITSGVVSPVLEVGIGFALLDSKLKPTLPCTVEIRGKHEPAQIVSKRFLRASE